MVQVITKSVAGLNKCAIVSNIVGFALSFYAFFVELKKERDPSYRALCDINEHMSCSKAFTSEYGKGFGVMRLLVREDSVLNQPNCLLGVFFYAFLGVLSCTNNIAWTKLLVGLNAISNILSVYLAYILFFILHDICVICFTIYIVNLINLIVSVIKLRRLFKPETPRSTKMKKKD